MHAFTAQRVQVGSGRCGQGFTFTGLHLRDTPFVQDHRTHQLNVEHPQTQSPLARFPSCGKGFNEEIVQRLTISQPLLERGGLVFEGTVA